VILWVLSDEDDAWRLSVMGSQKRKVIDFWRRSGRPQSVDSRRRFTSNNIE
jgi:hypothetical protein